MRRPKMRAMIRAITPDAVYQNEVYTQFVEVSVESTRFVVFDAGPMISHAEIGEELELELTTFSMTDNVRQSGTKRGIEVNRDTQSVSFLGEVVAINVERDSFLLDIGSGTIICGGRGVQGSNIRVQVGDFVIHNPIRVDLREIYA